MIMVAPAARRGEKPARLTAADAPLTLTDRNVAALQARALALSGLAAATGDPTQAAEAEEAFVRAHAVTRAAGVAAPAVPGSTPGACIRAGWLVEPGRPGRVQRDVPVAGDP